MIGIRTAGIHAPIANFDTSTTINTMKVAIAPIVLTATPRFQLGSRNV